MMKDERGNRPEYPRALIDREIADQPKDRRESAEIDQVTAR